MTELLPDKYTDQEGGDWRGWGQGPVDQDRLVAEYDVHAPTTEIHGVHVHALHFPDGSTWDVWTGFRLRRFGDD